MRNISAPGPIDAAATAHANAKVCKICGAHLVTPRVMRNGMLCYQCPMGHWWYEHPVRD